MRIHARARAALWSLFALFLFFAAAPGCGSGVDTDRFTPKMVQVAVQAALATADPPALCPIESGISKYDRNIRALVQADRRERGFPAARC